MIRNRRNIFFWLSRITCLLIFAPFFAVQCFYYYNAQAITATPSIAATIEKAASKNNPPAVEQENGTGKKATINLNKRFQPGSVLSVAFVEFEKPFTYCERKLISRYINPFSLCVWHHTGTLRGPPAC